MQDEIQSSYYSPSPLDQLVGEGLAARLDEIVKLFVIAYHYVTTFSLSYSCEDQRTDEIQLNGRHWRKGVGELVVKIVQM